MNISTYVYNQGRIQDLAQGGGQIGREAPEKFFVPPLSSSGGGQGGDSPPPEIALSKDFAPFIKWVYKKISRKKSLSPPWITQGGDILAVPPLNCSGGGQFSGGGQSPPWNCSGGGQSPIPPPCIRSCIYIYLYINNVMVWSGPFKNNCHENVPLSPFLVNCPFNTDF